MSRDPQHTPIRAFGWLSVGNGVRAVLKLAVMSVLARLLTPGAFGLAAASGTVMWLSSIFSTLGVGPALVQREEIGSAHISTAFTTSLLFGISIGALLFAGASFIADFFRMPELIPVLRVLAILFPITGATVVAESMLQRQLRFGVITRAEVISYILGYGVIGIALAWLGAGVWALIVGELAKTVIKTVLFLRAAPEGIGLHFDREAFRALMGFGSGYTVGSLSIYAAQQADNLVVGRMLGAGALGLYGRAFELMLAPAQAFGNLLEKLLLPTLARVQSDTARLRTVYRRCTAAVALLVLPMSAWTIVLAPEIVAVLLGPRWIGVILPLQVLAVGMYFRVAFIIGETVANSTGAVHQTAWRSAVHATLVVVGALIGLRWGLAGVAAGVVVAISTNYVLILQLSIRITGTPLREIVTAHWHGLFLAGLTGGEVLLVATQLRRLDMAPVVVLGAAGALVAITLLILIIILPRAILGEDGMWIANTLFRSASGALQPLSSRMLRLWADPADPSSGPH